MKTTYKFKARSPRGRKISGQMKAHDEADLARELKKIGLELSSAYAYVEKDGFSLSSLWLVPMGMLERLFLGIFGEKKDNYNAQEFSRTRRHRAHIRSRLAKGDINRMPTFAYLATNRHGNRIYGEMEARDEADLSNRLLLIELDLVRAKREMEISVLAALTSSYRVSLRDQVILSDQLEIYFRLDMVMTEILDAVRVGVASRKLKMLLLGIRNRIVEGDTLVQAMRRYPNAFSRFFLGIIEVGEATGKLSGVMMYGNRHLKWMVGFRRSFFEQLRMQILSVFFIVTLTLLFSSPFLFLRLLAILLVFYVLMKLISRTSAGRETISRIFCALPGIGSMIALFDTLNFTHLFSIMWQAGMTAEEALGKARHVIYTPSIREAVQQMEYQVHDGATLSESAARSELFSPTVVASFQRGEKTGMFEDSLEAVYYFYVRMLEDAADKFIGFAKVFCYVTCIAMLALLSTLAQHPAVR